MIILKVKENLLRWFNHVQQNQYCTTDKEWQFKLKELLEQGNEQKRCGMQ